MKNKLRKFQLLVSILGFTLVLNLRDPTFWHCPKKLAKQTFTKVSACEER
jgi:hypothetical protein